MNIYFEITMSRTLGLVLSFYIFRVGAGESVVSNCYENESVGASVCGDIPIIPMVDTEDI